MAQHVTSKGSVNRGASEVADYNIRKGVGNFTFHNGDKYQGEYRVYKDKQYIVKQEYGVYTTENFETYTAKWNNDKIQSDLCIRYNNDAEYRGSLDATSGMGGHGIYTFPDGSSMEALWIQNQPAKDVTYREPRGFIWKGQILPEINEIHFIAGNHFWDAVYVPPPQPSKNEDNLGITPSSEPFESASTLRSKRNRRSRNKLLS